MYLTIRGVVLRTTDYNDRDVLVTLLTQKHGKLTVKARNVRRKNSPLTAVCQLLVFGEFTIFAYRGQYTVNEARVLNLFGGLRRDMESLSLASYFAQVSEVLSQEDYPTPELQSLLLNSLYVLSELKLPLAQVKAVFELRLACLTGYAPNLQDCVLCGGVTDSMHFSPSKGGLVCGHCARYGNDVISPDCLQAMRFVATAPAKKIFSFQLTGDAAREFSVNCELYLLSQLERNFPSLDYYKRIKG